MIALLALASVQQVAPPEPLPIDAQMTIYEAAMPGLREMQATVDADTDRVGPPQPDWNFVGRTTSAVIAAGGGTASGHVLQRDRIDRPSIYLSGAAALTLPASYRRYVVRAYDGPIDYHGYYQVSPGIIIHSFGASRTVGNAECRGTQGVELLSKTDWQTWPLEEAITAFAIAEWNRDDARIYCTTFLPAAGAAVTQTSFTPDGRPYPVDGPPATFRVTEREVAARRLFGVAAGRSGDN